MRAFGLSCGLVPVIPMQTAYLSHPDCLRHDMGEDHPECPARLKAIEDKLIAFGIFPFLHHYEAPSVTREQLARVHSDALLDHLESISPSEGLVQIDEDTWMNPHTLAAAGRAAGSLVLATDLVMAGKAGNAFCCVRPPGHHASRDQSMGFCIFNNVAVGVAHALEHHCLERVAVIDFDAHHGNGTEDIFKDDPRVMLCSSFQQRIYPESIPGPGNDHMIFAPLPPRSGSGVFRDTVTRLFLPALNRFRPQIVFVSAGFDSHRADEMADLDLVEEDYAWITRELKQVAAVHSGRRLVSTLEGGYELQALGRSVAAHIKVLCDM